jgi:hypothetical protein
MRKLAMNPKILSITASFNSVDRVDTVYGLGDDGRIYWWDADSVTWQLLKS